MGSSDTTLAHTFVELADTLVDDFDLVDFLTLLSTRCTELFDVDEVGVLLADGEGNLNVAGSSSHDMHRLELLELQHDDGPCPDCYRSGVFVTCPELSDANERWPTFVPAAIALGMRSAHAVPLRLRGTVIGALNLLATRPGPMADEDLANAQALADIATIGILQQRAAHETRLLNDQLRFALDSRVIIEQAKGYVRHDLGVDMETAFSLVRNYARTHDQLLLDVAASILDHSLPCDALSPPVDQKH